MSPAVQPAEVMSIASDPLPVGSFHKCFDLIHLFQGSVGARYNTRLIGGAAEPEYLPSDDGTPHARILFTRDYFASALHEVAHWCVAGPARRQLADYGYWYAPDGRTAAQQTAFEQVEVKPQALEWIFAEAAGFRFRVSADNLNQGLGASATFKSAIARQVHHYLNHGLPKRAAAFAGALETFYQRDPRGAEFDVARL